MRVLMMSSPIPTHLAPMMPLAWGLRAAGHQVVVAGQPDIVATAHSAGLSSVTVGDAYDEVTQRRRREGSGSRQPPWGEIAKVWRARVDGLLGPVLDFARRWSPDLIIADPREFTALIAGGLLGVPAVQHRWGIDPGGSVWARARDALQETCASLGLAGLPAPALVLDPCPADLRPPGADSGRPIRFVPHNGAGLVPDWALAAPASRRICVSLGRLTVALNGPDVVARIVTAVAALDHVEIVVTIDPDFRERLGSLPGSVRLVGPQPLNNFLHTCDAIVHHGGSGTALTAAAFGLPQLVLPQSPLLVTTGDSITASGTGRMLGGGGRRADATAIRDAAAALLGEPGYRDAAGRLRDQINAMPAPASLIPILEDIAAPTRRGSGLDRDASPNRAGTAIVEPAPRPSGPDGPSRILTAVTPRKDGP
jgi:UDP:flavonoid glycosyltransferase YjiC (YdhE family)